MAAKLKVNSFTTRLGELSLACSETYLHALAFKDLHELEEELQTKGYSVERGANELSSEVEGQVLEYLEGRRKNFDVTLQLEGTDFQIAVWKETMKVPYGEVRTYKEVAKAIGKTKAYRAVGNALGSNHIVIIVPCHRIVRNDLNVGGYSGKKDVKVELLKLEGSLSKLKR